MVHAKFSVGISSAHKSRRSTQTQTLRAAGGVEALGQEKPAAWKEHKVYMEEWMDRVWRDGQK